jgi:hypothetical protein
MFFSEEGGSPPGKNQKTFTICAASACPAMAGKYSLAQK